MAVEKAVIRFLGDIVLLAGTAEFFYTSHLKTSLFGGSIRRHGLRACGVPPRLSARRCPSVHPETGFFLINGVGGNPPSRVRRGSNSDSQQDCPDIFCPPWLIREDASCSSCLVQSVFRLTRFSSAKRTRDGTKSGQAHLRCLRSRSGGDSDKQEFTLVRDEGPTYVVSVGPRGSRSAKITVVLYPSYATNSGGSPSKGRSFGWHSVCGVSRPEDRLHQGLPTDRFSLVSHRSPGGAS
jgi:hypothetical protein